ncbi:MAG: nuclear transport factor 2 family protein [Gemmatimonadetes bacterium]|nr:nuclear transport factor 2 family protein [Gemmatimonadota bacterium]
MSHLTLALFLGLIATTVPPRAAQPTSAAIDADVWKPVAASVVNRDIVAMGRVYHTDAVLVSGNGTQSISAALDGWGKGMVEEKAKGNRATVEFRFSKRQDYAETAFETGVFKYTVFDKAGTATPSYRQLETLLVKRQGRWVILMERQLDAVTESAWNALPR